MIWTNDLRINTDITPDAGSHQAYGTYRVNRTVSQSEIVPIAGFRRPKWAAASTNPNAPGMVATGYKISLHSPTAYKVTVTYSYPSEGVKEDEEATHPRMIRKAEVRRARNTKSRSATVQI